MSISIFVAACNAQPDVAPPPEDMKPAELTCPKDSELTYESFGEPFFLAWCTSCHSSALNGDQRAGAPLGMDFDTLEGIRAHSERIIARAANDATTMPPAGGPPASARAELGEWLACGAPSVGFLDAGVPISDTPDGGQMNVDAGMQAPPAMFSDTGEYATPITDNAAFCGPNSCDPSSAACCIKADVMPECMTTVLDECSIGIGCDGTEDCAAGACCLSPTEHGPRTACAASCTEMQAMICHTAMQCPESMPVCCSNNAPFGRCTTHEGAMPGERCDVRP